MRPLRWSLITFLVVSSAHAQEIGPKKGTLVIVGGAMKDTTIMERFIKLAGGPKAPIVIIPTAGGEDEYDEFYRGPWGPWWHEQGINKITILHTKDRNEANSNSFVEPIQKARGVWFSGGRQWRLADSYLDTRTEVELHALLEHVDGFVRAGGDDFDTARLDQGPTHPSADCTPSAKQDFDLELTRLLLDRGVPVLGNEPG